MPRLARVAALAAITAITASIALSAAPAHAGTVWLCGLSDDLTRIVCIADDPPDEAEPAPPATAQVNGTRFPLDARRLWTVDMWSPATEAEPVAQLARATLCHRTPDCAVVMNTAVLDRVTPSRGRRR